MEKKNILMISHSYPPVESVGGLRAYYFSKNLAKLGWKFSIVKLEPYNKDVISTSTNRFNGEVEIYQSKDILRLARFACRWKLFVPDFEIGWILPTFEACKRIIEKSCPHVIYATCSPFSSAIVGALIKKRYGIPLILDFRDPWSFNWEVAYPTYFHKFVDNFLEAHVLEIADHLIVVTENMRKEYVDKYGFLRQKISTITNGFDVCDLPSCDLSPFEKFTITYCGSFYGLRRPDLFLKGLKEVIIRKKLLPRDLQVFFLGSEKEDLSRLIRILGLDQFAFHLGYLSHRRALEFIFRSHMLLLVEPRPALTSKVFEYLATGKPILALVSKGELENLVKDYSDVSYVLTSDNFYNVAEAIYDCYDKWANNKYQTTSTEKVQAFIKGYNGQAMTKKLCAILDSI